MANLLKINKLDSRLANARSLLGATVEDPGSLGGQ